MKTQPATHCGCTEWRIGDRVVLVKRACYPATVRPPALDYLRRLTQQEIAS